MNRKIEIESLNEIKDSLAGSSKYKITSNCDFSKIANIFNTVKVKEEDYKFPDFFFDGGIIEHFIITGYKESKKGSDFMIEKVNNEKNIENFFEEKDKHYLSSDYKPNMLSSVTKETIYKNSSYNYFLSSFKKNFLHHLDSLIKSDYHRDIVVFIVEQLDGRMRVFKNNKFEKFYSLSKDKTILLFLKDAFPQIDFLVFKSSDSIEIIDLSKIDDLLSFSLEEDDIRGGELKDISLKIYYDI